MTIQLHPEQEQLIGQALEAGLIGDASEVVQIGLESIRQRLEARVSDEALLDPRNWSREFHAWVESHSSSTPLLSDEAISRDSLYGTRGRC